MTISATYTPRYHAQFIEPIAENLCLLAERRIAPALALYQGDLTLPDFSHKVGGVTQSRVYRSWNGTVFTELPALLLEPVESAVSPAEHDIPEVHTIGFTLGVGGKDGLETTHMGFRYTRALLGIWLSAQSTEITDGMGTASGLAVVLSAEVNYGRGALPQKENSQYFMQVGIDLSLSVREL